MLAAPSVAKVRARPETGKLYFDFFYRGVRCREQTDLTDTPSNRKTVEKVMKRIDADIRAGNFNYAAYFPNSPHANALGSHPLSDANTSLPATTTPAPAAASLPAPDFGQFSEQWLSENEVRWRRNTRTLRKDMVRVHLMPVFADRMVSAISRADLLEFRAALAKKPGAKAKSTLSPKTINEVMSVLIAILGEAADRYGFTNPGNRIKRLKVPRQDVQPFTLDEALRIVATCRDDFRSYFIVRFFTGMRSGEVHGLKWRFVDFERRQILVRESFTHGEQDGVKTDGSLREVDMSQQVYDALKAQKSLSFHLSDYVFCSRNGNPIDLKNFVDRVWNPLLQHLTIERRRPYQMRHTAATLWLAAGENPEWISRQLGHSTSEMLFRVYSRFVPNLTRNDGSAFERLLASRLDAGGKDE